MVYNSRTLHTFLHRRNHRLRLPLWWSRHKAKYSVMPHRSTTYADAAYCYRPSSVVCLSVCLSVCHTIVSPAKTAGQVEMPFGLRTWVGPRNHDGGPDPHGKGQFWGGKGRPIVKYSHTLRWAVQKQLNLWRCLLGCGLEWAHIVFDGSPEVLKNVAMATNFGTQFAITGFMAFDGL